MAELVMKISVVKAMGLLAFCAACYAVFAVCAGKVLDNLEGSASTSAMDSIGLAFLFGGIIYGAYMAFKYIHVCSESGDPRGLVQIALAGALIMPVIASLFIGFALVVVFGICIYFFFAK